MQGADKWYNLIKQADLYGLGDISKVRLPGYGEGYLHKNMMFVLGEHARGKTFRIWIYKNQNVEKPLEEHRLEVYGITNGQLGWSETYGWVIGGSWKNYIENYFEKISLDIRFEIDGVNKEKWYKEQELIEQREQEIKDFEQCFSNAVSE